MMDTSPPAPVAQPNPPRPFERNIEVFRTTHPLLTQAMEAHMTTEALAWTQAVMESSHANQANAWFRALENVMTDLLTAAGSHRNQIDSLSTQLTELRLSSTQELNEAFKKIVNIQDQLSTALSTNTQGGLTVPGGLTPATSTPGTPRFPSPTPSLARPRGADPPVFKGEPAPTRAAIVARQEEFTNWRSLLAVKLVMDRDAYPSPVDRILYTASCLGGDAYQQIRSKIDAITSNADDPSQWAEVQDYCDILKDLNRAYITIDVTAEARRNFDILKMEPDKGPKRHYSDFITSFIKLSDLADYDDTHKVKALRDKVSRALSAALVSITDRPANDDFTGWVEMFRQLQCNIDDNLSRNNPWYDSKPNRGGSGNGGGGGDPMDLSKIGEGPRPPLTDDERHRRRQENLCMYCGRSGHYFINCRARKAAGKESENA